MRTDNRWHLAQEGEKDWWTAMSAQLNTPIYLSHKTKLWEDIVECVGLGKNVQTVLSASTTRPVVVDIGCGPHGLICELPALFAIWFPGVEFDYYGIDPLMEHYLRIRPDLHNLNVHWAASMGESIDAILDRPVDLIISINAIDHVREIDTFAGSMLPALRRDGLAMVSSNCHSSRFAAKLWSIARVERLHPYHMTKGMYISLFRKHLGEVIEVICLDECYHRFQVSVGLDSQTIRRSRPSVRSFGKMLLETVVKYHGDQESDLALFHHYAFILKHKTRE